MTDDRLKAALDMAREAGDLAQSMRDSPTELKTGTKGPMDPCHLCGSRCRNVVACAHSSIRT